LGLPDARPIQGDGPRERTPDVCERKVRRLDPLAMGDFMGQAP